MGVGDSGKVIAPPAGAGGGSTIDTMSARFFTVLEDSFPNCEVGEVADLSSFETPAGSDTKVS